MNLALSVAQNRIRVGSADETLIPYGVDRSKRWPVIWFHGYLGTFALGPVEYFAAEQMWSPWICSDMGGTATWGGDAATGAAGAAEADRAWAVANLGCKNGKAVLVGGSMGGLNAIMFALQNPTKVAAVYASIPAFDPEYARANNIGGSKADIEAVYGVGPVPAARQVYQRGADFKALGIPLRLIYSTTDIYTPLASTQRFIAESGCQSKSLGAVGHNYLSSSSAEMAAFLLPYLM